MVKAHEAYENSTLPDQVDESKIYKIYEEINRRIVFGEYEVYGDLFKV